MSWNMSTPLLLDYIAIETNVAVQFLRFNIGIFLYYPTYYTVIFLLFIRRISVIK